MHKPECIATEDKRRGCEERGHFAKLCKSAQVANVKLRKKKFILTQKSRKLTADGNQKKPGCNSAEGKKEPMKSRELRFIATIDTGSPAFSVNIQNADSQLAKSPKIPMQASDR